MRLFKKKAKRPAARRGLFVPRGEIPGVGVSYDDRMRAAGLRVYDREAGLEELRGYSSRARRVAAPESHVDPLAGPAYDHQAELDGYLGGGL